VLTLPDFVPFAEFESHKQTNPKYVRSFNISDLANAARTELSDSDPECYKIFCLGLIFGLRRNEIDKLQWPAFRPTEGVIRIEPTDCFSPKTKSSCADLPISDPAVASLLSQWQARATGRFVVEGSGHVTDSYHLRCETIFIRLNRWLRAHGVTAAKPLHTLRKEHGSIMCDNFGIFAAKTALRHSNIAMTSSCCAADKAVALPNAGLLLNGEPANVIPIAL